MAKIDLLPNEAIILRDSEVKHDRGKSLDSEYDELVLTNQALIVAHKGLFGITKDVQRFPLDQVIMTNGSPRVMIGMSHTSEKQLHVFFHHGIEAFSLGDSDEDASDGLLDLLFSSTKDKENRNLQQWQKAVSEAVIALHQDDLHTDWRAQPASSAVSSKGSEAASAPVIHTTKKCIGCMAPLSGMQGQKVICKYCDTEQAL